MGSLGLLNMGAKSIEIGSFGTNHSLAAWGRPTRTSLQQRRDLPSENVVTTTPGNIAFLKVIM